MAQKVAYLQSILLLLAQIIVSEIDVAGVSLQKTRPVFLNSFSCVCPEPVLA